MNKLFAIVALTLGCVSLLWIPSAGASNDEAEIRKLFDDWAKAMRAHDVDGIMAIYAPDVVAYDVVPPLQYVGADAYRKDYQEILGQYEGPLEIEIRDLHIVVGGTVAYATAFERIGGTLKNGQRADLWIRDTSCFQKINGKWKDTHDHASVPVDFSTGKAALDLKP